MSSTPSSIESGQVVADTIDQIILNTSQKFVGSSAIHHLRASTLHDWCAYIVDASIEHEFHWKEPQEEHLRWWFDLVDPDAFKAWVNTTNNSQSVEWYKSISSSYYTASQAMFSDQIESLYVERRTNYEKVHCHVYDCGSSHGVAIETSVAIESGKDIESLLERFPHNSEAISLADISQGIPQILASTSPGEWLPPFFNGVSWILLQASRVERPSLSDLKITLFRDVCKEWRESKVLNLVSYWTNYLSE